MIDDSVFPFLGPLYLSSVLKQNGYSVHVVDLFAKGSNKEIPPARIYGVTSTSPNFPAAVKVLQRIREERHNAWMVLGGAHATVCPKDGLDAGFNQVCVGEGEKAILKIAYGDKSIEIVEEPYISDLDTIPFPDRQAIDMSKYEYKTLGVRATSIVTSRGCKWNCSFCCQVWPKPPRFHSANYVLSEITQLKAMGYFGLSFYDDELLLNWERDREIFQGMGRMEIVYRFLTRADLITEEKVELLANTGCLEVFLGLESGSDRILKYGIHKGTTRAQNIQAVKILREHGIRVKTGIVIGLPGEDRESLKETETMLDEIQPEDVDFTILTPMKGSNIALHPERYDLKFELGYTAYKSIPGQYVSTVSTSSLTSEEILAARDRLEKKFKKEALLR